MKPIVHYSKTLDGQVIEVGKHVILLPIDHTSPYVSNTTWATTSPVVFFDELTGEIETQNTRYIPQHPDSK